MKTWTKSSWIFKKTEKPKKLQLKIQLNLKFKKFDTKNQSSICLHFCVYLKRNENQYFLVLTVKWTSEQNAVYILHILSDTTRHKMIRCHSEIRIDGVLIDFFPIIEREIVLIWYRVFLLFRRLGKLSDLNGFAMLPVSFGVFFLHIVWN